MNKERYLVVVSGPSGCGKDTVVSEMRKKHPEIEISVSATSRAMRQGEEEGVNYYYLTRQEFLDRVQEDKILEYTEYNGNLYGTPRSEVDKRIETGRTVVLVIEVEGAGNIRRLYPDAITIFLMPPSMEELERRLRGRGTETDEVIQRRLERAKVEMTFADQYNAQVINQSVEDCAEQIYQIIQKYQQAK